MRVTRLTFDGFRNLEPGEIRPAPGVNVFYGDNAQGKTNLLEALWLFTGGRSFRGAKDRELVRLAADGRNGAEIGNSARLSMEFQAGGRDQVAEITVDTRRHATLNGVAGSPAAKLAGVFCGIVFSPTHLSLIKDGPEERRRFIDAACCQLRPAYIGVLAEYNRALKQRNAVLKAEGAEDLLSLWDEKLAAAGSRICLARQAYLRRIEPLIGEIYGGLSGGKERMEVQYRAAVVPEDAAQTEQSLRRLLLSHRREDRAAGFTVAGVHREDFETQINGLSARTFGSQGQQRSAVLALKLSEAAVLEEVTGEQPVALLDDVMSELDVSRQDYILNRIENWQVFITCCDPAAIPRLTAGRTFAISHGKLS